MVHLSTKAVSEVKGDNVIIQSLLYGNNKRLRRMPYEGHQTSVGGSLRSGWDSYSWIFKLKLELSALSGEEPVRERLYIQGDIKRLVTSLFIGM